MLLGLLAGAGITSIPWLARVAGTTLDSAEATTRATMAPYWNDMAFLPSHQYRLLTVYLIVLVAAGALGLAQHRRGLKRLMLTALSGLVLAVTATLAVQRATAEGLAPADAAIAGVAVLGVLIVGYEALRAGRMRPKSE